MLKKLVKYGNSTALVLDRAILELLNIKESATVKLKTDGTSLIITPEVVESTQNVFVSNTAESAAHILQESDKQTEVSTLRGALNARVKKNLAIIDTDPAQKERFNKCAPGTENFDKLGATIQQIMGKYKDEINKLSTPECLQAIKDITEKYAGNVTSEEYFKEICALRLYYAPLLVNMDAEMLQAEQDLETSNA